MSRREDIEAAIAHHSGGGDGGSEATDVATPVDSGVDGGAVARSAEAADPIDDVGGQPPVESNGPARARGADGKFVTKTTEPTQTKAPTPGAKALVKPSQVSAVTATKPPAQAPQPTSATPLNGVATAPVQGSALKYKAPQSLKPLLREKWSTLPEEWQGEIDRLERDAKTGIEKSSIAAKGWEQFQQVAAPFQAMLGGADPVQATRSLFQAAHTLNYAPPQAKAQLLARMIKDSGVPIELLDSALSGTPVPQHGQQSQTMDPESILRMAEERMEKRFQAQQQQAEQGRIQQDIEAFSAANEFFHDVQSDMVELVNLARARGVAMTLKQAYDRAVQLSPDVQATLKQREAAKNAPTAQAATGRKQAAASSVKSQPAAEVPSNGAASRREQIKAVLAASRRGT